MKNIHLKCYFVIVKIMLIECAICKYDSSVIDNVCDDCIKGLISLDISGKNSTMYYVKAVDSNVVKSFDEFDAFVEYINTFEKGIDCLEFNIGNGNDVNNTDFFKILEKKNFNQREFDIEYEHLSKRKRCNGKCSE